jgi:ABC-type polar amino acid transport system ATPase subunit
MYILDKIHKSYGHTCVLSDISCEIPTDGFVFILGPSGSGKSTLLRLLSFVEVPDDGVVRLELGGRRFDSAGSVRPWPQVTSVFQRQFLWPHLTLRGNITLPLRGASAGDIESKLQRVIDLFDMSMFVDRFPNEVSGGQAQRAALARALVLNPQVVLIDEAHGGLDLEQQKILNEHLVMLRQSGVGLIVVTHSLEFARKYADRVIVIENGTITEAGPKPVLEESQSPFLRRVLGL